MKTEFAYKPLKWLYDIEDKTVWATVFALMFSHGFDGEEFTEEELKREIADFDGLSKEQAQEVFDLIIAHKD